MDTGFQRHAGFFAHSDRLGTGINTTLFRHIPPLSLGKFPRTHTARLFSGKMFGVLDEKSWQRSAWFSHSDRTCGRKRMRCEQLVSNSRISNSRTAVTASSRKSAGISCREKVNICVPHGMHLEIAFLQGLPASNHNSSPLFVERKNVSDPSQSAAFSLLTAAIL